jgi:hypothetical protein
MTNETNIWLDTSEVKPIRIGLRFDGEGVRPTVTVGADQYVTKVTYCRDKAENMVEAIKKTGTIKTAILNTFYKKV